jgi:hypothetical protein
MLKTNKTSKYHRCSPIHAKLPPKPSWTRLGDEKTAHMIDERVLLQEVVDATQFYALLPYLLKNKLQAKRIQSAETPNP